MNNLDAAAMAALEVQTLHAAVVHKIDKTRAGKAVVLDHPTKSCLNNTAQVQNLIAKLHALYSKQTGKSYGQFEPDVDNFPTSRHLTEHFIAQTTNFFDFSIALMNILRGRMDDKSATGGYVLMAHLTHGVSDWLLVAMLKDVAGAAFTADLDVVESIHIDLSHLRVAGRVNLTAWQAEEARYISFLRGKQDPSDYFKRFLGCDNEVKPAVETRKLTDVLTSFADERQLDERARDVFTRDAHDFCADCAARGEPVSFEALANRIWPDEPQVLLDTLADPGLQLSDHFVPDRRALSRLVKFRAKTTNWSLEFDRKAILNGDIEYPGDGVLTIKNLPAELRERLDAERVEDND